jgi:hypothetical protein
MKYDYLLDEKINDGKDYKQYIKNERSNKYLCPRKRNKKMLVWDGTTAVQKKLREQDDEWESIPKPANNKTTIIL